MRFSGNTDLKEQSLNAYEVGYTANLARAVQPRRRVLFNDSKQDFSFLQIGSYTSQNHAAGRAALVLDALIAANAFGRAWVCRRCQQLQLGKVRNKGTSSMRMRVSAPPLRVCQLLVQAQPTGSDIGRICLPRTASTPAECRL